MSFFPVQAQNFKLQGAGVAIGATTVKLTSFTQIDGTLLTMADFGSKGYLTVEPGVGNEEQISFTGVTQNSDGTATLSGVSCVSMVSPYTEVSGFCAVHVGGTVAILTNTSGFYSQFPIKSNAESITGTWTFAVASYPRVDNSAVLPSTDAMLATKKYVDGVAIAGAAISGTGTLGISRLSTAAVVATSPIVVGDNDTRVPTQGENDALAGTRGTPNSTNKFVTDGDTSTTGTTQWVARYSGTGILTVATTPTNTTDATSKAYVDGMTYIPRWIAGTTPSLGPVTATTVLSVLTHNLGYMPRSVGINASFQAGANGGGTPVDGWGEILYQVSTTGTLTAVGGTGFTRYAGITGISSSQMSGLNRSMSATAGAGGNGSSIDISVFSIGTSTLTLKTTTVTTSGVGANCTLNAGTFWAI